MKNFKKIVLILFVVSLFGLMGCQAKDEKKADKDATNKEQLNIVTTDKDWSISYDEFVKRYAISIENIREGNKLSNYEEVQDVLNRQVGDKSYDMMIREYMVQSLVDTHLVERYAAENGIKVDENKIKTNLEDLKKVLGESDSLRSEFFKANALEGKFLESNIRSFEISVAVKNAVTKEVEKEIVADSSKLDNEIVKVKARHILLDNIEDANAIEEQLKAGEDFSKLAKEKSKDTVSGEQGGDLGYFTRGRMVKEFEDAAFSLKKGEISQPIKTMFGYHIIKIDDSQTYAELKKNEPESQELELIRNYQLSNIINQKLNDLLEKLRSEVKITVDENLLKKSIDIVYPKVEKKPEKTELKTTDKSDEKKESKDDKDLKSDDKENKDKNN